jgi:CBS-domain-containing membrane protein
MEILIATLLAFVTFPGIIGSALLVGAGYVLRKYTTKTYPTETAALDAIGSKYGRKVEAEVEALKAKLGL